MAPVGAAPISAVRPPIDEHAGSPWRWDPLEHRNGAAWRDDAVVLTSSAELLVPELDLPQAPSSDRVLSAGIVGARR